MNKLILWLTVYLLTSAMLGCGGSGGTTSSAAPVTGVATPAGISVVTAN